MIEVNAARHGGRCETFADEPACIRTCAWPGCGRAADYRAPKSRTALRDFHWFCLEHVRRYNAGWNYFNGLDAAQIELIRQGDATWHRPTWPLGGRAWARTFRGAPEGDPAGAFGTADDTAPPPRPPSPERNRALESLGLGQDASPGDVKARYKELAKRHHPDANGGCKRAEERLKRINEAYSFLRDRADA